MVASGNSDSTVADGNCGDPELLKRTMASQRKAPARKGAGAKLDSAVWRGAAYAQCHRAPAKAQSFDAHSQTLQMKKQELANEG